MKIWKRRENISQKIKISKNITTKFGNFSNFNNLRKLYNISNKDYKNMKKTGKISHTL